jgi:hypothetical protein
MSIEIFCPKCQANQKFQILYDSGDLQAKCKYCQILFQTDCRIPYAGGKPVLNEVNKY